MIQGIYETDEIQFVVPPEFTRVPFPVKALKIILRDLQAFSLPNKEELKPENAESDDGVCDALSPTNMRLMMRLTKDETWGDEEVYQGLKKEEYGFLSGMRGITTAFKN